MTADGTLNLRTDVALSSVTLDPVVVSASRGRFRETLNGTMLLVATRGKYAAALEHPAIRNRFAYAPAIAAG